jgi:tetratricopeptide (TPR) repeat protein
MSTRVGSLALGFLLVALVVSGAAWAASPGDTSQRLQEAAAAMDSARTFLARKDEKGARRRLEEAEDIYRDVLRGERDHRDATLGLGSVLFLQRRYDEGVRLLEPVHGRAPNDADVKHQLGLHLYRAGQQQRGLAMLGEVAADGERFDAVWIILQHHYNNGDFALGLPWAQRYASARPEDIDALALIGTYYLKSNLFDEAIDAFDRYLKEHPDNLSVTLNRANALFRRGRHEDAAGVYTRLLERNPGNNRYTYNLASVRVKQDRCADAVPLLEDVLKKEPGFGPALYFRADCLRKLGDLERAEAAFREAAAAGQSNPWVHYGLSQTAWGRKDLPAALEHAARALELGSNEAELHAWRGTLVRRDGRPEDALPLHDRAIALAPEVAAYHVERGYDLFRLSRADEAVVAFARAMELAPDDARARSALLAATLESARSALDAGRAADARRLLDQAVKAVPTSGRARAFLTLVVLSIDGAATAEGVLRADPPPASDAADIAAAEAAVAAVAGRAADAKRLLADAVAGQSDLVGRLHEVRAVVAAADGDWTAAARAYDDAAGPGSTPRLDQARALAWLQAALDRLGRGDGGAARESLGRARALQKALSPDDVAMLEFATQALATVGAERPDQAAQLLSQTLAGARYQSTSLGRVRDLGQGFVAHAWMRAGNAAEAVKALDRVRDRRALGGAWEVLRRAADDLEARRLFAAGRPADAERLWAAVGNDPISTHNVAAARFAAGRVDEAENAWRNANATPPESLWNLGNALARRGDHRGAWDQLRRYLATGATTARDDAERRVTTLQRLFGFAAGGAP